MDLRMLSRELSLYLEHQVRVGFFGSGVGLSLILGFSVAYACYYLSSIAKVSQGLARARGRRAAGGFAGSDSSRPSWNCRRRRGWLGPPWRRECRCSHVVALSRAAHGRPLSAGGKGGQLLSACLWVRPGSLDSSQDPADLGATVLPCHRSLAWQCCSTSENDSFISTLAFLSSRL